MNHRLDTPFMADNPRITVVGCGGTGGFVAEALCRLYTGRPAEIVLVDHDRVEPHNLLRQNFYQPDVGRYKSEALAERLSESYGRTIGYTVKPFREQTNGTYPGVGRYRPGLMIGCVDNARARREMEECLRQRPSLWLIDAGNGKNWGQVLIGNRAAGWQYHPGSFKDGVCSELPSPAAQRPDLLNAVPETPPDIDCAAALDLLDQDPTINQTMAMLVVQVVRRMAANDCPYNEPLPRLGAGHDDPGLRHAGERSPDRRTGAGESGHGRKPERRGHPVGRQRTGRPCCGPLAGPKRTPGGHIHVHAVHVHRRGIHHPRGAENPALMPVRPVPLL